MDHHEGSKTVYRIQGLTCTGCAAKFEKNVKKVAGVLDAKVNYGASKLIVFGDADPELIQHAGSLDGLRIIPENETRSIHPLAFWKNQKIQRVGASTLLLLCAWTLDHYRHENTLLIKSLFILSILIGGVHLFQKGLRHLFRLEFDMNALMTIAIIGAAAIGEWEEGAAVVILFSISEALETYSMDKARNSIQSLMALAPKEALIIKDGKEVRTPVDEIRIGDVMIIKPGEKLAMDGVIQQGTSSLNEASITGESMPVTKTVGDDVFAGTLNTEGALHVSVTKRTEDTTIAKIIHLVEEAQGERAPSQAFVDRFAKVYTPFILLFALSITLFPPLFLHGNWEEWFYRGLALLVVGCPCALVISTPISIVTAIGSAARNGILIKGGIYLEEAASLDVVAFDKTGTLTKGFPVLTDFIVLNEGNQKNYLQIVAAIENKSQHPIASAITRKAEAEQINYHQIEVEDFTSFSGKGVKGVVGHITYYIGNPTLFEEIYEPGFSNDHKTQIRSLEEQGKTVMVFGTQEEMITIIAVTDEVRESSSVAVQELHALGITNTVMLTGDNTETAKNVQQKVGVKEVHAHLLPHEKLEVIKGIKAKGSVVAMVGDGINDAPALATASIGIAMGGAGTDTALETADMVLMGDDLRKLPVLIKLSRYTLRIIKQNVTFSLSLKAIALLLIIPGWLTLWMAVFADMGATVLVTLNSLRLTSKTKK